MHTPIGVTKKALKIAKHLGVDTIVSIGGGSTTRLGKAISIRTGIPHICILITYQGSEMTPILGETADGIKTTRRDPKLLPGTIIYNVDIATSLPIGLIITSSINAIAYKVEALYTLDTNPIIVLLVKEDI